jgi:hypothetical protein
MGGDILFWLILLVPASILLIWGYIYDKRRKSFYYGLNKNEMVNYAESDLPQREFMTTSINPNSTDDGDGNL